MKKSTTILILIIYVASIVLVGFFGMSVKVYDEVKYIKSIEISVEAESEDVYNLTPLDSIDPVTGNPQYNLVVHYYDYATLDEDDNLNLMLNLIPKVKYDTGDIAGSSAESVVYTLSSQGKVFEEKGYISLNMYGTLSCKLPKLEPPNNEKMYIGFQIHVKPATKGGNGTGAVVMVYII